MDQHDKYGADVCLRIAGRYGNSRRVYLLVNPLQAKHVPVSPHRALAMMRTLGARVSETYPHARLVIGFAETATALGAAVAEVLGGQTRYLTTTRETYDNGLWTEFAEEHSHAVMQRICREYLPEFLADTAEIIIVDDEFSTGKTLLNIVEKLRQDDDAWQGKKIVAASLINRLTDANELRWQAAGIDAECLLKLPYKEYEPTQGIAAPLEFKAAGLAAWKVLTVRHKPKNPRLGVNMKEYAADCRDLAAEIAAALAEDLPRVRRMLLLGTEECMYPALIVGEWLEERYGCQVYCHATTRSPIGINEAEGYPVRNGYLFSGLYEASRRTYLYNLAPYDLAVIVTDAKKPAEGGLNDLCGLLNSTGTNKIYFVDISD